LLVIAEDLVGVRRLLELLLGRFVVGVLVGMELLREPAIGLLHVTGRRATLDPEDFIQIAHGLVESTPWVIRLPDGVKLSKS